VPDEARQPSVVDTEMVPIHTKQILLWQMRERELVLLMPFCFSAGRHFCISYLVPGTAGGLFIKFVRLGWTVG